ncbi:hypothetical protein AVEN_133330-1 [Araneus ventricosus]|uniref:Uncharacterized protein n=1 Tax=Araneus ventricosus TaxID=182803 RepID=A0A4Y2DM23_ARAVE|nr:hypothetical protein AVEN_133330-1 [Araneus ventricosus]
MCPSTIKNLFTDSTGELYLWLVHGQLALFNNAILEMEKDNTTAFEVAEAHKALKRNLTERTQIAILVCSRFALQVCKLSGNLSPQVCKCETSLQHVNASLEVTIGRTCSKLALQTHCKL